MRSLLNIENVSIGYGKKTIARALNLNLEAGEMVCLLGPNGVGKSTLLRCIARLQKPLHGKLFLKGQDLYTLSAKALAKEISVVLTDKVESNLSIYALVSMGRYPYTGWGGALTKEDETKIRNAIEVCGLRELASRPMYQLSDGELQKTMIAKALAQDTPLILLDEPTAHLDIPNRMELLALLRRLSKEENKAILLSSHDLETAMQVADRIWLMGEAGSVITGIPEDLLLQGEIQQAFTSESLNFDMQRGSFQLKHDSRGFVFVEGEEPVRTWTIRALARKGWGVKENAGEVEVNIEAKMGEEMVWKLIYSEQDPQYFPSLEQLLQALD